MNLIRALRLDTSPLPQYVISLVGSGGKTTALFKLARQLLATHERIFVTATSHLGAWQTPLADHHIIAKDALSLEMLPTSGIILVTGEIEKDRTKPVSEGILNWLHEKSKELLLPLLIEADGSRQKPLKAPADYEPPIPPFSNIVIHVSGLSVLGKPLVDQFVHRAEIFSHCSELPLGAMITPQAVVAALTHPQGGLKNIPPHAKRIALLNQADTPELQSIGGGMAKDLLGTFNSVIVGSLKRDDLTTIEPTAGIILAAGNSTRYGEPKQLLDWKGRPFVRHVAETALQSGLEPVVVVTGFHHAEIESTLQDLPVHVTQNLDYTQGQSTSIKAGLTSLPEKTGAAIFLLADQPQIPVEIIRALVETHTKKLSPVIIPLVLEERRANPVLFDRVTFPHLMQLTGDVGGRAIFNKFQVEFLPWHDDLILFDVDKPEDYERLKGLE